MNIYVTGPVGVSGALNLYKENKAFFARRFAPFFLERIEALEANLSEGEQELLTGRASERKDKTIIRLCDETDESEITLAKSEDCIYICTITDGGLFGALWNGCEKLNCGCEVFLENIPVRQEVIEITELMNENPYEMESFGNLLLFAEDQENGICIGKTTDKKDRVVVQEGNRRFLTPPARQQKDIQDRQKNPKRS